MNEDQPTERSADAVVSVRGLYKYFRRDNGTLAYAIDDLSFDVRPREFVVLLGPSGCGKTTLLRAIAGLEVPDQGQISIHGSCCFDAEKGINRGTEGRGISMVFQSYALWPHMTAFENIAYPLRTSRKGVKRLAKDQLRTAVVEALERVGIPELIDQYPGRMSGGQQQRVALARALAPGTGLVLFDEPLSNVDAKVREQLRGEIVSMQRDLGFAAIYVTHDQDEAMAMADRIAVLDSGRILQFGSPQETYFRPASRSVANFVGKTNEIHGVVSGRDGDSCTVSTAVGNLTVARPADIGERSQVIVSWRTEHCAVIDEPGGADNCFPGRITGETFLGSHCDLTVDVGGLPMIVRSEAIHAHAIGDRVFVQVRADLARVFPDG